MKKVAGLFSCIFIAIGLVSCDFQIRDVGGTESQEIIGQYETVSVLLTQTAQIVTTQNRTPSPAHTVAFSASTPIPTLTYTPVPLVTQAAPSATALANLPAVPCDLARAGMPIDVTIPDDTRVRPGEIFSKTWRLVNAGSCTWDRNYAVVWFSGDELGLNRAQNFNGIVVPGQSVDVTVDMQAPKTPGIYQSNWKLRNNQGTFFGIGPGGTAPFWARVVVVPAVTDTPTVTPLPPSATPTPIIFFSGLLDLEVDTGLDLDSGEINQVVKDDVRFQMTEQGQAQLLPENGARLAAYGRDMPEFLDCASLPLDPTPVVLEEIEPGAYLCFRTTEGLPGWVVLSQFDVERQLISLEFVTWAVP
jgi:hypothetical protein